MLPQILDVGDGKTVDRNLAIEATRHVLLAMKLTLGGPNLDNEILLDLADMQVSHLLGRDHWHDIANELVDEVLKREASHG